MIIWVDVKSPCILELVVGSKDLLKNFHLGWWVWWSTCIHLGGAIDAGWTGMAEHSFSTESSLYKKLMTGQNTRLTLFSFVAPFLLQPGFLSLPCRIPVLYQSQVISFASLWRFWMQMILKIRPSFFWCYFPNLSLSEVSLNTWVPSQLKWCNSVGFH